MLKNLKTAVILKQLWLGLVPLISLVEIAYLLLSPQSFATIPEQSSFRIAQKLANSNTDRTIFLELGKSHTREISGDEKHEYQITLQAGQYWQAVIEQKGIDVRVTLFDPNGQQLGVSDSLNSNQGPEPISVVAEVSGNYRLEVQQSEQAEARISGSGRYEVTVKELRTATEQHKKLVAAEKAFMEATQLHVQTTEESMRQAIAKWQEALPVYQEVGDRPTAAFIFTLIGDSYKSLNESSQALDYYKQALPIYQALGDKAKEALTFKEIGLVYASLGEKKALEYYNQARIIERAMGNKLGEANTLFITGLFYQHLKDTQKAIEYYNQVIALYQEGNYQAQKAHVIAHIAEVYLSDGESQKALSYYHQTLSIYRTIGNKAWEANTLLNIGSVYQKFKEKQKALEYYDRALSLYKAMGYRVGEARALNNMGLLYSALGEKQKALEFLNQSLPLSRTLGDKAGEGRTLNNIGLVYSDWGENQKALEYYNQSLPLARATSDKEGESSTLDNIARLYSNLGDKQKALELFKQSLPLSVALGDKFGESRTLNNMAVVYQELGEVQKALDYYNQSLSLKRSVGDKAGEAANLNNMGQLYSDLGENQKALKLFNQSLLISRTLDDKAAEATTLSNIGGVYLDLGENQKALDFLEQSLPLRRSVGDRDGEATTLGTIGLVYFKLGEKQKVLELFNQSLALSRAVGSKPQEAIALNNIGQVYSNFGEHQKALEFFNQALPLLRAVGNREGEASAIYNIAFWQRNQGNLKEALTHIETAITIIEDLRTKIGSQELRASYFATVQDYYQLYIDLLMHLHQKNPSQGYDEKALHISERARARSLLELLTEATANIRSAADSKLLEQERDLQQQLNIFEHRRYQLLSSQYNEKELNEVKQKIDNILAELKKIEAQIRTTTPRYADLKYPEPLNLQQIQQQVLDDDTLLLEYSLSEIHSYLWAVSKNGITSYILPKQSEIEAAVQTFRQSITKDSTTKLDSGLKLSQMLLAPVANQLANKRLLIVGDGVLQYVPFAALPAPSFPTNPLLVQNEIVTLPSASTVAIQRRQLQNRSPAPKTLAVIADPVFHLKDERITGNPPVQNPVILSNRNLNRTVRNLGLGQDGAGKLFDRLEHTRTEAEKILALIPETQHFQALDFNASRQIATNPNLANYQIIHFATHGLLDPTNPELSGIVLSLFDRTGKPEDGFLRLHDIFNLNLPAELVVLSACQTGLGENVKGEGLVGLTRGFMYAGAKRVVVSLWSVNDAATSELMAKFYQKMLREKQNPVTALREAQLEMWKSPNLSSPYYWAAFTLQGDWR